MSVTWSKVGKELTAGDFEKVEKNLGLTIPQQFREFLLETNGGAPKPRKIRGTDYSVTSIFNLSKVPKVAQQYWDEMNLPRHQIPIGFADQVDLLVMDGEKVVIHTNCEGGIGMFGADTEVIAPSFNKFLAMLETKKTVAPSNSRKFIQACEMGKLKQVKEHLAAGVDWNEVAVPALVSGFNQLIGVMNDYTLLTLLFEAGVPLDTEGDFEDVGEVISLKEHLTSQVLPNEKNALNLFDKGSPEHDQVKTAVAQLENIVAKYFGG